MKSAARCSSVRAALVGAVLACGGASVLAQAPANGFPSKTVRIISAFPAGSGPDAALRLVAEQLARKWGQPVVVDNRPGGNGFIAINAIKQSPTDGHELIQFDMAHVTTHPFTFSKLPYDPRVDLEPVRPLFQNEFFVAVGKDSPYRTLSDIVAAAAAKPGQLTYGSWFNGSPGHLGALRLEAATNTKMVHVPYKDMGQLYGDVASQQVQWALGSAASAGPLEKAGKLRFIATTGTAASGLHPQLPQARATAGAQDFSLMSWTGLAAPRGTPKALREKISADVAEVIQSAPVQERYRSMGYDVLDLGPDAFVAHIEREKQVWGKIIAAAGLKLD
jgi:tripartite-type tricarboxylate transporter receptor subunit TctC